MVEVLRGFRFAIDPNDSQLSMMASHCGAARFAFNWGLALLKERLDARRRGEEVELPWTLPALRREFNRVKAEVAPWWAENSKEAYSSGLRNLARALGAFSDSRQGRRKGARMGFPRFRRKFQHDHCGFSTGAIRVEPDGRPVVLPRLGRLRVHERTDALLRLQAAGRARILGATISREAGRWLVSFQVSELRELASGNGHQDVLGIDLGLNRLATLSDGTEVANPRPLRRRLGKLQRLSRAHSRTWPGSRNRRRSAQRLARCHARVSNQRNDLLHQLTTRLAKNHGVLAVEDLGVRGMLANRRLAGAISDAGWGELRRQLTYKSEWYRARLVVVDRWYPSSKTCSGCGAAKAELGLSQRRFDCSACGLSLDRDLNAARNLAGWAEREAPPGVAVSATETGNGSRRGGKTWASRSGGPRNPDLPGQDRKKEQASCHPLVASVSQPTDITGGR
jgi:putative transposase